MEGLLKTVIAAISSENFDHGTDEKHRWILSDATLKAIETFRTEFDAVHPKTIDKGMHYRYKSTQQLYDAYEIAAERWSYNYEKCALFGDGVLIKGLVNLPTNDAMRCCQGLKVYQKGNGTPEASTRLLKTIEGHHFYTYLRGDSVQFSIVGSCIDIENGMEAEHVTRGRSMGMSGLQIGASSFKNSCKRKMQHLATLCSKPSIVL